MHKHTANTRNRCGVLSAALALVCLLRAADAEAQGYTITDLGTLGGTDSQANAVSNDQVVGVADTTGEAARHAFSWTSPGPMVDLGTLGGTDSRATAVSNGQVVGFAFTTGNAEQHGVLWRAVATPTPTPTTSTVPTPTSPLTATSTPAPCIGDCDGGREVTINELITLVNIALGTVQPSACAHGVPSGPEVNVAVIIQAVNNALSGCPVLRASPGRLAFVVSAAAEATTIAVPGTQPRKKTAAALMAAPRRRRLASNQP